MKLLKTRGAGKAETAMNHPRLARLVIVHLSLLIPALLILKMVELTGMISTNLGDLLTILAAGVSAAIASYVSNRQFPTPPR